MSWKRRTRAVAWTALLLMACTLAMPSTSAAFPIKWWINPQLGDPDLPTGGGRMLKTRVGSYSILIYCSPTGLLGSVFILATSSTGSSQRARTLR